MMVSIEIETSRSMVRLIAIVDRGGSPNWKSSIGTSAMRFSSVPGPSTAWLAGTMVTDTWDLRQVAMISPTARALRSSSAMTTRLTRWPVAISGRFSGGPK